MNIKGVEEDENEEVVDPFYTTWVEAFPLPELDWDLPEQHDLQPRNIPTIERTKNWLEDKNKSKLGQAKLDLQKGYTNSKLALPIHCIDTFVTCSFVTTLNPEPKMNLLFKF